MEEDLAFELAFTWLSAFETLQLKTVSSSWKRMVDAPFQIKHRWDVKHVDQSLSWWSKRCCRICDRIDSPMVAKTANTCFCIPCVKVHFPTIDSVYDGAFVMRGSSNNIPAIVNTYGMLGMRGPKAKRRRLQR